MTGIIQGITGVLITVVSIDIIDIPISVIIDARLALRFGRIDPHPVREISMRVVHSRIHHRHHHLRCVGGYVPRLLHGNIRPSRTGTLASSRNGKRLARIP